MKRRSFIGTLGIGIVGLKSWAFGADNKSRETQGNQIILEAGHEFILPKTPKVGQKYEFSANSEWVNRPAIIRRNGQFIMGEPSDLTVDVNIGFCLVFLDQNRGWSFV